MSVEYRPGKQNTATDTLSHCDKDSSSFYITSSPSFELFDTLWAEVVTHPATQPLHAQLARGATLAG